MKIPNQFLVVPFVVMVAAFLIGQFEAGAGVPVVILLSTMWVVYARQRWGVKTNG